jgi:hypothetical protein
MRSAKTTAAADSGIQRVAKRRRAPSQTVVLQASRLAMRAKKRRPLNSGPIAILRLGLEPVTNKRLPC